MSDGRNGAWTRALDDDGNVAIVRVGMRDVIIVPTGLAPSFTDSLNGRPGRRSVGAGAGRRWRSRDLPISPQGDVTRFDMGQPPAGLAPDPVADGEGHLWFGAADDDSQLVLVRITATRGRR